jgi:hypothetical protein
MSLLAPDPIIVYGAPRSGTSYLNAILNEQPGVFITHETRIFVWAHKSMGELLDRPQVFNTHLDRFRAHLRASYPDLIRSFYASMRPRAVHWGDKNPHYAAPGNEGCLETIVELFPGARFIHIIRDGRDVVASLIRKTKPDGSPWIEFEQAHHVWADHVDIGRAFGATLPAGRYHELRYEDLISDDVGVARRVFDFLGLAMDPAVVDFCEQQQRERTPLSGPTRDMADVGASQWAAVLTPAQQDQSLSLIGERLGDLGYQHAAGG